MASEEWVVLEVDALMGRIQQGLSDRRGLSIAHQKETQLGRSLQLVLACGACWSPTAGLLADGSLATYLPDSFTDDAVRLCESGWLSRFSSTMGASGDITMPSMPIPCSGCGVSVSIEGSALYVVWNSVPPGETVAIALQWE